MSGQGRAPCHAWPGLLRFELISDLAHCLGPRLRYVPKTYLNQQPRDSVDKSALKSTSVEFDNFTYVPKNPLDQDVDEN